MFWLLFILYLCLHHTTEMSHLKVRSLQFFTQNSVTLLYPMADCCLKIVLYRTQRLITVLIHPLLSQLNSADILIYYLLMIHFNIIISSTTTSSNVPLQVPLHLNYWAPCNAVFFVLPLLSQSYVQVYSSASHSQTLSINVPPFKRPSFTLMHNNR